MRLRLGTAIVILLAAARAAAAAPRVLVCLPKDGATLEVELRRSLTWAELSFIGPDTVAERFPPSPESLNREADERRVDELLHSAETAFLGLRLDQAATRLDEADVILGRLPVSARYEPVFVKLRLLRGRVESARRSARAADSFAAAAETSLDLQLDEAEYPPEVRQAFLAARDRVRARPPRTLEISSEPSACEVEVNGQLAGRTPATLSLPAGRCFLSVSRAGYKPYLSACPAESSVQVRLTRGTAVELRDQLRERIASDPGWFVEPLLLDTLAAEEQVKWIILVDRDRGGGLKAFLFSTNEHSLRTLEPARFVEAEIPVLAVEAQRVVMRKPTMPPSERPSGAPGVQVRATPVPVVSPAPGALSRWYVWTALGVALASAVAAGIYLATRPDEVTVTFGARQ